MGVETWTERMRAQLVAGYLAGDRFDDMAERIGVTDAAARAQIRLLRKTQNIPLRKDPHRPASPHVRCDFRITPPKGLPFTEGGDEAVTLPRVKALLEQGCQVERIL